MTNINLADFDVNKVNIEGVSKNQNGGKQVRITYGPNHELIRIRGCAVPLEWGFSRYSADADPNKPQPMSIELALRGHDEQDSKVKMMYDKLKALDDKILEFARAHAVDMLGRKLKPEEVSFAFRPLARTKEGKTYPTMRIKIAEINKKNDLPPVFDMTRSDQAVMNVENLAKEAVIVPIFMMSTVYIMGGNQFGLTARLMQACQLREGVSNDKPQLELDADELALITPSTTTDPPATDADTPMALHDDGGVAEGDFDDI